jgi:hypothetical protein
MRYASIFRSSTGQIIQMPFSGPRARGEFERRCIEAHASWGYLYNEATGEQIAAYTEGQPPTTESLVVQRLSLDPPVMASAVAAELVTLIGKHGDKEVLFAIPDEGAFNVTLPRFDSDGAGDDCFLL